MKGAALPAAAEHLAGEVEQQELGELGALRGQQRPVQRPQQGRPGGGRGAAGHARLQVRQRQLHHGIQLGRLLVCCSALRCRYLRHQPCRPIAPCQEQTCFLARPVTCAASTIRLWRRVVYSMATTKMSCSRMQEARFCTSAGTAGPSQPPRCCLLLLWWCPFSSRSVTPESQMTVLFAAVLQSREPA